MKKNSLNIKLWKYIELKALYMIQSSDWNKQCVDNPKTCKHHVNKNQSINNKRARIKDIADKHYTLMD